MSVRGAYKPSSVIGGHLSRPIVTGVNAAYPSKKQAISGFRHIINQIPKPIIINTALNSQALFSAISVGTLYKSTHNSGIVHFTASTKQKHLYTLLGYQPAFSVLCIPRLFFAGALPLVLGLLHRFTQQQIHKPVDRFPARLRICFDLTFSSFGNPDRKLIVRFRIIPVFYCTRSFSHIYTPVPYSIILPRSYCYKYAICTYLYQYVCSFRQFHTAISML